MEPSRSGFSLEAYLGKTDFCIRSLANGVFPLFQLEDEYSSENGQLIEALYKEEFDDKLLDMFQGYGFNEEGVPCQIFDLRDTEQTPRRVWLRRSSCSSASSFSEDSEPFIPDDDYFDGFCD